jgi:hypothetical protein
VVTPVPPKPFNPQTATLDVGTAEFDGLVWMSRLCNDAKAYVFFGDECA